jgi:hypothetical protein
MPVRAKREWPAVNRMCSSKKCGMSGMDAVMGFAQATVLSLDRTSASLRLGQRKSASSHIVPGASSVDYYKRPQETAIVLVIDLSAIKRDGARYMRSRLTLFRGCALNHKAAIFMARASGLWIAWTRSHRMRCFVPLRSSGMLMQIQSLILPFFEKASRFRDREGEGSSCSLVAQH